MKNKQFRLITLILLLCIVFSVVACNKGKDTATDGGDTPSGGEVIDYAGSIAFNPSSTETKKLEVTVKLYIDGDTTHFHAPAGQFKNGVLKARYIGINTPESTGLIEEWGKKASNFTRETLREATSIYVESDDNNWNLDTTKERHVVWVWYKNEGDTQYRNLNIELLQNGLAIANNSANNRYGETCQKAIQQARDNKLYVYSGQKDPDYPYGEATELTIRELRRNIEAYSNKNVAFEGVITKNSSQTVYVEEYDEETDMYYGMQVYYGYNLSGSGLEILNVGNRVRIVGTVTLFQPDENTEGVYQVSGLQYRAMKPNDPNNIQKISDGHEAAYFLTTADEFVNGKVTLIDEETETAIEYNYSDLAVYTSIEMHDLYVQSVYTTNNGGDSDGAMTLTCTNGDVTLTIRTEVLREIITNQDGSVSLGELITADYFLHKTIDVKGIIGKYDGRAQIMLYSVNDVVIH